MQHRHLNHERCTLAAIDDVIARGKWRDWAALRRAALDAPAVLEKVRRVCAARIADPYAQRHHFWMHWTRTHWSGCAGLGSTGPKAMPDRSASTWPLPDWEQVLSAAAHLQGISPEAGLDGIETGVRQLIREEPLETTTLTTEDGRMLTVPTAAEILRVKGVLILRRNATRDYLDFAALADRLGDEAAAALATFDALYPQPSGESSLQQLQAQLANPLPYDLDDTDLTEYKALAPRWHDWAAVQAVCARVATATFDHVCARVRATIRCRDG